jgi:hypothetical protein
MNFDLNIDNYNTNELIEMFELPDNFDKNILDIKEAKLKESIINNNEIDKNTQFQTLNFIVKAKNIILNSSQKNGILQKKIENFYNSSYELQSSKIQDPGEHMVQLRDNKPYLSSFPSEFFTGVINPLKKRTLKKNLNIDTKFRENYYSSPSTNFNLVLPTTFTNVLQMHLSTIELPTTYYAISQQYGNNFFTIGIEGNNIPLTKAVLSIPDGNYDPTTIIQVINNQIQTTLSTINSYFLDVSFNSNIAYGTTGSGQTIVGIQYTGISNPSFNIILDFQADRLGNDDRGTPLPLKLGWILGFRNGIYENNHNYVSEGIIDTHGPRYLFLVVDDYNNNVNNSFFSAFNNSVLNNNILARISLTSNGFNVLEQNNLNIITTPRDYFGPVNLLNLNIQLLDEYGRIVNLNNMDYSFCLTLTTVYDL